MEEEEENRYDYGSYSQTNRVGIGLSKQKTKLLNKGTAVQVTKIGSSKKVVGGLTSSSTTDKTPTKRKLATGS